MHAVPEPLQGQMDIQLGRDLGIEALQIAQKIAGPRLAGDGHLLQ